MKSRRPRVYLARVFASRPRLAAGIVVAVLVYIVQPGGGAPSTRLLIAWNAGTLLYLGSTLIDMARATPQIIRRNSVMTDDGPLAILILVTLATAAAMGAIVAELSISKDLHGLEKNLRLALAGLTILSAWVFIHFTFALHYAHEFFDPAPVAEGEAPAEEQEPLVEGVDAPTLKGGLRFPDTQEPDYWDFLYFSFIIGVASQTADVKITSQAIRRTSLAHSILSFIFNSSILALVVNIAAGLI